MSIDGGLKITMIREDLNDLPDYQLPAGYSFQWYLPGMENDWVRIHEKAEPFQQVNYQKYEKEFGSRHEDLKLRQCFIKSDKGEIVGTATAWFDTFIMGEGFGRVHWVAIVPEEQGKKLSNCLLSVVLQKLKELNYDKVYLTTSSKRLAAIHLYLKFGFVPSLESEDGIKAWSEYLKIVAN
jgi:GNAT superfamily N-acetyltransferase